MAYTEQFCARQWQDSCGWLSVEQRVQNNLKWVRYWDHLALRSQSGTASPLALQVLEELERIGMLNQSSTVLDVGAGTGAYALPLAARCAQVVALDMSPKALSLLEKRAHDAGVRNLRTNLAMWEEYADECRYDLAFSAMCPAICDCDSLARFEAASTGDCALLTVGKGSRSWLRSQLRPLLTAQPLTGLSPDVIYSFNLLYAQGKQPELRFFPTSAEVCMTVEEAVETYGIYYSIFGIEGGAARQTMRGYLESIAADGICTDQVQTNYVLMTWRTGGEGAGNE